jgi:hypothetical protein
VTESGAGASALNRLLAAIVRGDEVPGEAWTAVDPDAFMVAADHHGVLSLVAERWRDAATVPAALRDRASDQARLAAAADLEREVELRAVIAQLAVAGVAPMVFKGVHLAYAEYARPDLRPRLDTDILIPPDRALRQRAHEVLLAAGYDTPPHVGGDLVMTQRMYTKRRHGRLVHAIDLHWRLANPQAFARVLDHAEISREAVPVPRLGPAARAPSTVHALFIAALHRVAHHADADALIWLRDLDLLARRLNDSEWARLLSLAGDRGVARVTAVSLARAADAFGTPVPADVLAALRAHGARAMEASAASLTPSANATAAAFQDLRAARSWRVRLRLAREHVLPSRDYMRAVYGRNRRAPLIWLYVSRVVGAARRWLTSRT